MSKFMRLLLGGTVALIALGLISGSAFALRSIQMSNPGAITGTGVNVSFEDEGGFLRTVCAGLTLRGTGNERIAKNRGAAIGSITEGRTTGCRAFGFVSAEIRVLAEPEHPFPMTYNSILGTLPNITGILTITNNAGFQIRVTERTCLYEGSVGFLFTTRRAETITVQEGSFLEEATGLKREVSTGSCPAQGRLRGRLTFERARTLTLV